MLKKTVIYFAIICAICLLFTTCKRYPEGGWSNVAIRHLSSGKGLNKNWRLKLYEVNGIDSTSLIIPNNGITNFQNESINFQNRSSGRELKLYLVSKIYEYRLEFDDKKKQTCTVFTNIGPIDTQCKSSVCERNILNPKVGSQYVYKWNIIKLKSHEFVITSTLNGNNYKISLVN